MLLLLADRGEVSVGDVVEATGQPRPTICWHLGLLRRGRVADCRREGQKILYRISSPFAAEVLRGVRED
jgi:DNA-binding transcriptional ArsR family regulator